MWVMWTLSNDERGEKMMMTSELESENRLSVYTVVTYSTLRSIFFVFFEDE